MKKLISFIVATAMVTNVFCYAAPTVEEESLV